MSQDAQGILSQLGTLWLVFLPGTVTISPGEEWPSRQLWPPVPREVTTRSSPPGPILPSSPAFLPLATAEPEQHRSPQERLSQRLGILCEG